MSIPEVATIMQDLLGPKASELAIKTGFVRRASKVDGSVFARTLVFGWLEKPSASLQDLTQTAEATGVTVTPQGLDERFRPKAVDFLKALLEETVAHVVRAEPVVHPLLGRFAGVYVQDSTVIPLPDSLEGVWLGCGGTNGSTAALKLHVRLDMSTGALEGPYLAPGREHDRHSPAQKAPLPSGALRIADLGFFDLQTLATFDAHGVYFLTRILNNTLIYDDNGGPMELEQLLAGSDADEIDVPMRLGSTVRLPVRIVARRVPMEVHEKRLLRLKDKARKKCQRLSTRTIALAGWNVYATNVPAEKLSAREGHALMRIRWQIELLFKLWKDEGRLDESRSHNPWRVLCEIYAKLISLIIQHWILLTCCWRILDRSLTKAARTLRRLALDIARQFHSLPGICEILQFLARILLAGSRLTRRAQPNSYQILLPESLQEA
jgi:hypothetical protein